MHTLIWCFDGVPLVIAQRVADGQIGLMAVTAFAQGLNVFERGINVVDVLATHPARHLAM